MGQRTLLPDATEVFLECVRSEGRNSILLILRTAAEMPCCPQCQRPAHRQHSHYLHKLSDLPWEGVPVRVQLRTRRFFCDSDGCGQQIFTERLPNTVLRYARRTRRSTEALDWITLALGGQAGARLASRLGLLVSGSTLLRQVRHRMNTTSGRAPRVLGIDDWAWRKGHHYGTLLCDMETRKVVDMLPDRATESVERWLRAHPGVEIISRDRAGVYAEAASNAAPDALQVADRWHLVRNLSEALRGALEPHHKLLTHVARAIAVEPSEPSAISLNSRSLHPVPVTRAEAAKQQNRERRKARYESAMEQLRDGASRAAIARALGIDRRTLRGWIRAGSFPERKPVHRRSSLDGYQEHLDQRWQQGCRNATQLWRELREQGFSGQPSIVRRWILQRYGSQRHRIESEKQARPLFRASPRHAAWLLLTQPDSAHLFLERLCQQSAQIAACSSVAREFLRMVRERDSAAWPPWLESAKTTSLARFAQSLQRDQAAVTAALQMPWSNGPVEGHIHRLKLIKRQMYGRAGFDLLRLRVLQTA